MNTTKKHPLPQYLVADVNGFRPHILTTPAKSLTFPLSVEDKNDIAILEAKYDEESNIAGLAAPQVGIAKKIIVFAQLSVRIQTFGARTHHYLSQSGFRIHFESS